MIETWYILEDGAPGDPNEIGPDDAGVLRHKDGRAVGYGPHGPLSRSVDADALRSEKKPAPKSAEPDEAEPEPVKKEAEPEKPKRTYKTRESKAD